VSEADTRGAVAEEEGAVVSYWMIADGDGNELADGVSDETVEQVAQRMADDRGESVYASECLGIDEDTGARSWGEDVEYMQRADP
jgi:hypothetical protein